MHQARKRFGQHFLRDQSVIDNIVNVINPQPDEHLLEIGPGLGAITLPVLARIREMDAVEIDRDVIAALKVSSFSVGTLHLHEADVLVGQVPGDHPGDADEADRQEDRRHPGPSAGRQLRRSGRKRILCGTYSTSVRSDCRPRP